MAFRQLCGKRLSTCSGQFDVVFRGTGFIHLGPVVGHSSLFPSLKLLKFSLFRSLLPLNPHTWFGVDFLTGKD
jgi:hypothetical protein